MFFETVFVESEGFVTTSEPQLQQVFQRVCFFGYPNLPPHKAIQY
jgi:hypothetical protein